MVGRDIQQMERIHSSFVIPDITARYAPWRVAGMHRFELVIRDFPDSYYSTTAAFGQNLPSNVTSECQHAPTVGTSHFSEVMVLEDIVVP